MASNISSYWRTRRKILCNVDAHVVEAAENIDDCRYSKENVDNPFVAIDDEISSDSNVHVNVEDANEARLSNSEAEGNFFVSRENSECDSSCSSVDDCSDDNLPELLAQWAKDCFIPMIALGRLLHILHKFHPTLPLESRTLLETKRDTRIESLKSGGNYCHVGILQNLQELYCAYSTDSCFENDQLYIQVNIDGLPLFKSSSLHVWPILGILKGLACEKPFTIGVYAGNKKPDDVHEFLGPFTSELKHLHDSGFTLGTGSCHYFLNVHSFVCDAPARSMLKQTKLHCGYNACERCVQKGEWFNKVVFTKTDAPLRTDVSFDEMADENHHIGLSPLRGLGFGLVTHFCLDYMHLICLGIMRKLLLLWMRGPRDCHRLSAGLIQQISERLLNLRPAMPCEFGRRPRTLLEVDRWKATEFRQLLVYSGPVVFKGILSDSVYKHFMLLSFSTYCCLSADLCRHYADFVRALLVKFVNVAGELYGKDALVYNVHSVMHIVDDVELFGPLDSISSFPFENYLRIIKRLVRRPSMPLQQIICRLSERSADQLAVGIEISGGLKRQHVEGPVPESLLGVSGLTQYKELNFKGWVLKPSLKDGVVLLINGEIVVIRNIICFDLKICIVYQKFLCKKLLYNYPVISSDVNIYSVSKICMDYFVEEHHHIQTKCVCMPLKDDNEFAIVPYAHKE